MTWRVCVYCGASPGFDVAYSQAAASLGRRFAHEGIELVYGGGRVGLMGVIADAALAAGGTVIGVIPEALAAKELAHGGATEMIVVRTMHERKARMEQLADGFVALPGGFGTYDELFEILTWAQLGEHAKPVVIHDVGGFYEPLYALLASAVSAGFLHPAHAALPARATDADEVVAALRRPSGPAVSKWLGAADL
jgi:uncharacterized protein (TIGR00730 family)